MGSDASKSGVLADILRRERAAGFQDKTVIGGLDRFVQRWSDELAPLLGEITSYSILTPRQRERWAASALDRLSGLPASDVESAKPTRVTASRPQRRSLSKEDSLDRLPRVGAQTVARLKRMGLERVGDLIYHFPNRHNDFSKITKISQLRPGEQHTIVATVWEASQTGTGPRRRSTQAVLGDDTGNVRATWFNQAWIARTLRTGTEVVVSGKVGVFRGQPVFQSPEYEPLEGQEELLHTGRLVPVYPSTERLTQRTLRRTVKRALDACLDQLVDFLPDELRRRTGLMHLQEAVLQAHYPESEQTWNAARRRLAFDELLLMQLAILQRKREWQEEGRGPVIEVDRSAVRRFLGSLDFELTAAQIRSLDEILEDLPRDAPMGRLLQGDVGSGKTVVAVAAQLAAVIGGYQTALMVPTEILAEQHFINVSGLLAGSGVPSEGEYAIRHEVPSLGRPVTVGLLLGSLPKRAKEEMHEKIAVGEIDIVIGTHALIQAGVDIPRLGLVVVDEQHRFGVMQRGALRDKGERPHLLAMSATPIPRSLALTLYGDLDISVIDELPAGRLPIRTRWVEASRRDAAYGFVRREVTAGRQAFIVCPLVEESEAIQSRAAVKEHDRLSTAVFPDLSLGLLHGRMSLGEKERVMEMFKGGEIDVLISTPVVEVGIDVPNATVMLIDGADRFGLAQLHQFRGRVGRGAHQSYCLLLTDAAGGDARERLKIVERVGDGFRLAEEDLRLRGPGDRMGTRQSGLPDLRMARVTDQDILRLARREAAKILAADPGFHSEEHRPLGEAFRAYSADLTDEAS